MTLCGPRHWRTGIATGEEVFVAMLSVLATKPATSTRPPAPTMMPAGLTSQTRPLELSVP
jgi:hypothetical protein